ncbi:unnamed protein product [Protopolystoma xenopodis]|uniref:Uncharacterized protein n=1 Tax=Protopolystoma xenopodis TaxID=117903 RepID=A0A448XHE7_9PLAT|nr:unnamed protein product [Protopolystoma xenopodis]
MAIWIVPSLCGPPPSSGHHHSQLPSQTPSDTFGQSLGCEIVANCCDPDMNCFHCESSSRPAHTLPLKPLSHSHQYVRQSAIFGIFADTS